MKVKFDLDTLSWYTKKGHARIIGTIADSKPYVSIGFTSTNGHELSGCIKNKDLERFAVNILKALKSKKLK